MSSTEAPADPIKALIDQAAILDAVHRYCRGVDRADAELTRSAYHPDATDDHGRFKGLAHDFAVRVNASHASRWSSTMHVVANHSCVLEGDVADAETYVIAYLRRVDGAHLDVVGGRYIDRFERRQGDWRIARRVYICEWSAVVPAGRSMIDPGGYVQGRRGPDDLSYTGLLERLGGRAHG